jgi:putative membrane protein insertion efficiency factor
MNTDDRPYCQTGAAEAKHSIPRSLDLSIPSCALDHWTTRPLATLLKLLVRLYQYTLGTVLPNSCRYQPTCSQYALDALTEYGAVKGVWLTLKRITRCHPFAAGGYDPVPAKEQRTKDKGQNPDFATAAIERRTTTG